MTASGKGNVFLLIHTFIWTSQGVNGRSFNLESTRKGLISDIRVDSWTFILWALTYSTENVGTSIKKKAVNLNPTVEGKVFNRWYTLRFTKRQE